MKERVCSFHPVLFSLLFVILPYTQYAGLIPPSQAVLPFIAISAFSLFVYLVIKRFVGEGDVTVAVVSPLLAFLCNYGALYEYISSTTNRAGMRSLILSIVSALLLIGLFWYIYKVSRAAAATVRTVNQGLFVVAGSLLLFNSYSIMMQSKQTAKGIRELGATGIHVGKTAATLPDIYHVILDEYASPTQMRDYFRYDMGAFVGFLKRKGFSVSEMQTKSLATVSIIENRLNMAEISGDSLVASRNSLSDSLLENINRLNSRDEKQLFHIRNNRVVNSLKAIGYQFVNIGSWYVHTRYNRLADQELNYYGFQFKSELPAIIASNSVLRLVLINRHFHRVAVLEAFSALRDMPVTPGTPRFVFAHIVCPHVPYVFGANGEKLGLNPQEKRKDGKQLYIDQHAYITKKIIELVEHKLSDTQPAPVLIIQADHGARMDKPGARRVFSAVYVPGSKMRPLGDSVRSINTYRLIFNEIFGSNLEILN